MKLDLENLLLNKPPEPEWLVPDILNKGSFIVLAGEAGVGKSFLSYTLALALASGNPFLGKPTSPSRVLYFDEENSLADIGAYLHWAWRGLSSPDLALLAANLRIEHFSLQGSIADNYVFMRDLAKGFHPDLIIIDTATPACRIEDENDNSQASNAIRLLRMVRFAASSSCTMLVLKHARFNHDTDTRDIRGAKAWKSEADSVIFHVAATGRPRNNGLRKTFLEPEKSRAFGLKEIIEINPSRTPDGGLILTISKPSE